MQVSLLGTSARYFLEVARTGSLTLAAEQLHVASSAISRQIAKLEQAVGCPLFERRARGMVLSEAGERLAAHVRSSALEGQRVLEGLQARAPKVSRPIRVACTDGFACGFMASVMQAFRRDHDACAIHLVSTTPEGVSGLVARGDVDVGLKFSVSPERAVHVEHQQPAPILWVTSPRHPQARQRQVSLKSCTQHPMALPNPGTTLRQTLDLAFGLEGLRPQVVFCGNLATLLTLVRGTEVATFSSRLSVSHLLTEGELVAVPVRELRPMQRNLQVLTRPNAPLTGLSRSFVDDLIAAVIEQG